MIPKYRAWDKHRNEMNYRVMVGNCDTNDKNWTCPIIWIEERKDWLHFDDYNFIMQSTGLKDKNGEEIFEGDIVKDGEFARIVRYHQTLGFYVLDETGIENFFSDSVTLEDFEEYARVVSETLEVIGNIYQNKELLKEK